MACLFFVVFFIFTLIVLYHHLPFKIWELGTAIYLLSILFTTLSWGTTLILWCLFSAIIACFRLPTCRQQLAHFAFKYAKGAIISLSKTEEQALNTGDTWFEKDIFQGAINWDKLSATKTALTQAEQDFINQETQTLCEMLKEWDINQQGDLPPAAWAYIKAQGFLGIVIDKKYGGKGFSARAHSDIIMKIASHSGVGAVTVMVPNSLGPGELLQHYGTAEQKKHYLPMLASGQHIPCFALTEPGAGSDATSIESEAIVIEKTVKGKKELYLSITLNKRWITLAPVATLIGVAVQLKDPKGLLKGVGETGITCVLIERDTPHLELGNRHLPAHQVFMNGPVRGKDIQVPITQIIGGQKNAGNGWQMLVECLSIGRAISLPALATSSTMLAYLTSSAYARVRRQFHRELVAFEGIQEKLAQIGGLSYLLNATRLLTVAAVNQHLKPATSSAITKFLNTESARTCMNDAMDIHAGRTVVAGPSNYLLNFYQSAPISITVEGANILSRNLLIFGQGSMMCHPFLREEFQAISQQNEAAFTPLLWQHLRYSLSLFAKAFCSTWTGGWLIVTPKHPLKRACQKITHLSYQFAWLADIALMLLGGKLKRKERLSARLADALNYLYAALATLHEVSQHDADDILHAKWATQFALYQAQKAMITFCEQFPMKPIGYLMKYFLFPFGQTLKHPGDHLEQTLSKKMCTNNDYRQRLKKHLFLSDKHPNAVDQMEATFQQITQLEAIYQQHPTLRRLSYTALKAYLEEAVAANQLSPTEMTQLIEAEKMRWKAEQVDEFPFDSFVQVVKDPYPNPLA